MMSKLKPTTDIVRTILEDDLQARNNDGYLYIKVLEEYGNKHGIDYVSMQAKDLLPFVNSLGVPNSETVRRSRQKIQATYPELAACDKVAGMRMIQETEFRQYARGEV